MESKRQENKIIRFENIRNNRNRKAKVMDKKRRKTPTRIIAITSGKGGVGKTNIVANLGYALSKTGNKVLIFDADLGLGNIDILLGITPQYNLSHVINGEKSISDIIVKGPANLNILPASSGIQEMTGLSLDQRLEMLKDLDSVIDKYDILLIDTAAGISSNVLHFNTSANEIMVVVTPEPTSITDAYALMKILSLKYDEKDFKLIVNSAVTMDEAGDVFRQLNMVTNRFLDISIEYFGAILLDDNVKKSVKQQKLVSELAPVCTASRSFAVLAKKISTLPPQVKTNWDRQMDWAQMHMHRAD
ncbi:MAG: MinD/ParA family protein [Desulfobacteraceae bacterium]|nr:MinD/ParA family protein [Desulfobacteraceae bacterium]